MGKNGKKRKHAQFAQDEDHETPSPSITGVASTLAHLQAQGNPLQRSRTSDSLPLGAEANQEDGQEDWTVIGKNGKRLKRSKYPALDYSKLHRQQSSLRVADLQDLVLYCLADGVSPQWIAVKERSSVKKAVVLLVPGLETGMFDGNIPLEECPGETGQGSDQHNEKVDKKSVFPVASNVANHKDARSRNAPLSPDDYMPVRLAVDSLPVPLKPLGSIFAHRWPVKAPGDDKFSKIHSPLHAMLTSPIPKSQEEKRQELKIKGAKPVREGKHWESVKTPITAFVASREELMVNEYTPHPALFAQQEEKAREHLSRQAAKKTIEAGWVDTLVDCVEDGEIPDRDIQQGSLTAGRTVLAMDCEMCKVEDGELALSRVSIVGWDEEVVMDELVKPKQRIIDYLTPYSGITAEKLATVSTTLEEIQKRLLELFTHHTIIVGHSLNADLMALKITHPFIVDTSLLYQHPRGPPMKSSLKWLAQKYLGREIQKGHGSHGHDSIEDARACLDLVKLKCQRGPSWGTCEAAGEPIFKRLSRSAKAGTSSAGTVDGKKGAIVDHGAPQKNFGAMADFCFGCSSDSEVVEGVKRAVLGDSDGSTIPGGGVEFTWARLRELENIRGWSVDHRNSSTGGTELEPGPPKQDPSSAALSATVALTVQHIQAIRNFLPPCTLFIVYSGTGDPRAIGRLQEMQRQFKREYAVMKWDELSVKWTDVEEQALKQACRVAREGLGLVAIV
ncbi:hypothetical protein MMC07_001519 [Pseudocyphellaria aurata]|nr:hypothetical protein [Pseudocyphellaria aurata]